MTDLNVFLKQKCDVLEKIEVTTGKPKNSMKVTQKSQSYASTDVRCYYCESDHTIFVCQSFLKLSTSEGYNAAKNLKLCIVCLRNTHPTWKCKSQRCFKCRKSHNVLLHKEIAEKQAATPYNKQSTASPADPVSCTPQQQVSQPSNRSVNEGSAAEISRNSSTNHSTLVSAIQNRKPEKVQTYGNANSGVVGQEVNDHNFVSSGEYSQTLLSTALIKIKSKNAIITCRALIDNGSQSNFVTTQICKRLNLEPKKINHVVKGVGNSLSNISNKVNVTIGSCTSEFCLNLDCLVLPQITEKLPLISFKQNIFKIPPECNLADPKFNKREEIHCLLGASVFWAILRSEQMTLGPNCPILQNTELGWRVGGNCRLTTHDIYKKKSISHVSTTFTHLNINNDSLDEKLVKFWSDYNKFMNEYLSLGHMREVCEERQSSSDGFFMPHHAVLKSSSLTTKCRIVFNASESTDSDLWKSKIEWDDPVPESIKEKWVELISEFKTINDIKIPRHALISEYITVELHGYCYSSEKAYGACLYLRSIHANGKINVSLLCAKSRVAPVKKNSLPRCGLMGAVLLANLAKKACRCLNLGFDRRYFWTDSTITLAWEFVLNLDTHGSQGRLFTISVSRQEYMLAMRITPTTGDNQVANLGRYSASVVDDVESVLWTVRVAKVPAH
ncbi:hypothetical protein JTB14_005553 [Gonioctena quinquepunctata]|nr:hypothetical protein JTB14_005553 [Gonioctena quinquepunctata]